MNRNTPLRTTQTPLTRLLALAIALMLAMTGMEAAAAATAAAKPSRDEASAPSYQYPLRTKDGKRPYITSRYGKRVHPVYKVKRKHYGTDYRAACGTPLHSVSEGVVTRSRYDRTGYGWWVEVRSKTKTGRALYFRYAHMKSKPRVREGKRVKTGQRIGSVGTTGTSTGCHLHLEIRRDGRDRKHTINPAKWLKRAGAEVVRSKR